MFRTIAISALVLLALSGCATRDQEVSEVARSGFDKACEAAGGEYVPPTWPTGEIPAHCAFYFPDLPN